MTDHLCLKWNNHSSSFLKYISKIQNDEKFCDATIACQGKYFPVHRIVLSTCSDYFAEIFDRMVSPHPYIIFKDIEPREMNLLLTYMYKGEINVTQDILPSLIKAAEALRIKGLAVPDEEVENKGRRSKSDESKRNKCSDSLKENETNMQVESLTSKLSSSESTLYENASKHQLPANEVLHVKEEPVDVSEYSSIPDGELDKFPAPSVNIERPKDFSRYASTAETVLGIKSEEIFDTNSFDHSSVMHVKEEPVGVSEYGSMAAGELDKFPASSDNTERQKDFSRYATTAETLGIQEEIFDTNSASSWTNMDDVLDVQTTLSSERTSSQNNETSWTNMDDVCDVQTTLSSGRTSSQNDETTCINMDDICDVQTTLSSERTSNQNDTPGKNCGQRDFAYECLPEDQPGTYLIMNSPRKLKIKCSFCDYENYRKCHVKTHEMQKHTGERPFPCTTCSKKFVQKIDLERHIRVHTGEKPYHCHWCGSKFSLKGNLRHHMLKKTCR